MRVLIGLALATALGGCAGGMIPGQIMSEQGRVLDFEIEKARRSGAVTAHDRTTGERFAGTYVGMMERVSGSSTAFIQSGNRTAQANSFGSMGSNIANASAMLSGDKGGSLQCEMKIEASIGTPHGIGGCTDQLGQRYRLQF